MTYRILSMGTFFVWWLWNPVQKTFSHGLVPEKFWDSQLFLRNELPWVLPWLLGSALAAVIGLSVQKLTGWFELAPLGGRWFMRAAVVVQAGATLFHLLAWLSIDWQMAIMIATVFLFMTATALALAGWITFVVVALNARFRRA